MKNYNEYQDMAYRAMCGGDKVSRLKLYDLLYNGQRIVNSSPYPICNGKKSELLRTGNYQKRLFEINLHK